MTSHFESDDSEFGKIDIDDRFVTDAWIIDRFQNQQLWTFGDGNNGKLGLSTITGVSSPIQVGSFANWVSASAGVESTLAIGASGTLWAWGVNSNGQLGLGDLTHRSSPVQVGPLTSWKQVSNGNSHVLALTSQGNIWTWGGNSSGQLGLGDLTHRSSPVQLGSLTSWKQVYVANSASYAISKSGELWAWGVNTIGQLGLGDRVHRSSPTQVGSSTNWASMSNEWDHTVATKTDGTLWAWGNNAAGQLGLGDIIHRSSPVQVGALTDWSTVSAGKNFTTVIKTDGSMWAWGDNYYGQTAYVGNSPVQAVGSVAAGDTHSIVVKTDGSMWAWGDNDTGQLGVSDTVHRSSPIQVGSLTNWSTAYAGSDYSIVKKTNNSLWAWGKNNLGQTGVFTQNNTAWVDIKLSPYYVGLGLQSDGTLWSWGHNYYYNHGQLGVLGVSWTHTPIPIGSSTDWNSIGIGKSASYAIKTNGTLWAWGGGGQGALGLNDTVNRSTPVQVGALTNWALVSGGQYNALAVKTDGTLWAWGSYYNGMLGLSTQTSISSPVQVGSLTNWWRIYTNQSSTVAAVKQDGTLWTWGSNSYGQLGLGDRIHRSSPVQVGSFNGWSSVSMGRNSTAAIRTNGTLWTWGSNGSGQLGLSDLVHRSSPVQVGSLTTWKSVANGQYNTMATRTDGTLWVFGSRNGWVATSYSSPVQVGSLTNWDRVSAASDLDVYSAIDNSGDAYGWGMGYHKGATGTGFLGTVYEPTKLVYSPLKNSFVAAVSSPVQVTASTNWKTASLGVNHSLAIKTDGTLWAWGDDTNGKAALTTFITLTNPTMYSTSALACLSVDGKLYASSGSDYYPLTGNYASNRVIQIGSETWKDIKNYSSMYYTVLIKSDNTLWHSGQINNVVGGNTPYSLLSDSTDWASLATPQSYTGSETVSAIKTNGTLWVWGNNSNGALGLGDNVHRSSPVQFGTSTDWKMVTSGQPWLGIKTNGTLWAWGRNEYGQLGLGNTTASLSSPVQIGSLNTWVSIGSGAYQQCFAVDTSNNTWVWGNNDYGQLGLGDRVHRSSPTLLAGSWRTLAVGDRNMYGVKTNGTLWSWGMESYTGTLGLGSGTPNGMSSPTQIGSLTTWVSVTAGYRSGAAIRTDNSIWTWGNTNYSPGPITFNNAIGVSNTPSPTQIGSLTIWNSVSAGAEHSAAVRTDGTLWTWGLNGNYQLGLSDTIHRSSPTQVGSLTNWKSVAAGSFHTAAIKTDGTLWVWGNNISGQLGLNDTSQRISPVQVGALNTWDSVFSEGTSNSTIAKTTNGQLWGWGYNIQGQLGLNDTANRSSPVQVASFSSNWDQISVGAFQMLATQQNTNLWLWGHNNIGQLGLNDVTNRSSPVLSNVSYTGVGQSLINSSSPVQIGTMTDWKSVSSGDGHVLSTKKDGTLWSWGRNDQGQLGVSDKITRSSPMQVGTLTSWRLVSTNGTHSVAMPFIQ